MKAEYIFTYSTPSCSNCATHILAESAEEARNIFATRHPEATLNDVVIPEPRCEGCEAEGCQECCPHEEHDHFICLNCGFEGDPSDYYNEDDYDMER